jgi:FemAB-related protein (PEP-CTERM system-associated)
VTVKLYCDGDGERWDSYVLRSSGLNCYHLKGWKEIIERSFGQRTHYLFSETNTGEVNGILPLVHLKSAFFGNFLVSMPYFNYGGICADNHGAEEALLEGAIGVAKRCKADHIELRHTRNYTNGLPAKTAKVSMRLSLPSTQEELWRSFPSKLRSQVQRPIKVGMFTKLGREEELNSFYSVFSFNMRDLGTPVYSKMFFRNILKEFPKASWILTVYTKEGFPVASGFLVGFKDVLEIPWASSLRSHNRFSPNMLLYWNALQFGCEHHYGAFDFGRSTPGEGTYRFKEQWGANPVQLYWHYWLSKGGPIPELNPHNPKFKIALYVWQRLPLSVTNLIGPSIVKNLP